MSLAEIGDKNWLRLRLRLRFMVYNELSSLAMIGNGFFGWGWDVELKMEIKGWDQKSYTMKTSWGWVQHNILVMFWRPQYFFSHAYNIVLNHCIWKKIRSQQMW